MCVCVCVCVCVFVFVCVCARTRVCVNRINAFPGYFFRGQVVVVVVVVVGGGVVKLKLKGSGERCPPYLQIW